MRTEIFTQLTAQDDQMLQQYELRKRFCIDDLRWTGRTVYGGLEWDEFDSPFAVYLIVRDDDGTARGMARFNPCSQPYMIEKVWPHLVQDCPMPKGQHQWEATRLCVEKSLGNKMGLVVGEIMKGAEEIATALDITEFWWLSPKERIDTILPHNHTYVGSGEQAGDEFCFVGYSMADNMVMPKLRPAVEKTPKPAMNVSDLRVAA